MGTLNSYREYRVGFSGVKKINYFCLVLCRILLSLLCNQKINDMNNVNSMETNNPKNRPSFNEWCVEFKVSSGYVEPNKSERILRSPILPMRGETVMEKLFRILCL